ncbi:hypothetical protein BHE74_00058775 [Ensete ventricosum]|nr:hypothetical protein GW17_00034774 [Ensete ventricosum]RWW36220.1 hypothetical protein BHE74_00058775 [Ensete ventricosum]RZS14741.1 hypothetical protein BHM03_00046468 [Ensete ventricosum]
MAVDFDGGDAAMAGAICRSEGQREKRCDRGTTPTSRCRNHPYATDWVGKVSLLVEADTTVVVHEKDTLV